MVKLRSHVFYSENKLDEHDMMRSTELNLYSVGLLESIRLVGSASCPAASAASHSGVHPMLLLLLRLVLVVLILFDYWSLGSIRFINDQIVRATLHHF